MEQLEFLIDGVPVTDGTLDVDEIGISKLDAAIYVPTRTKPLLPDDPHYALALAMMAGWQVSDEYEVMVFYRRPSLVFRDAGSGTCP